MTPNLVVSGVQLSAVGGHTQEKKAKNFALQQLNCVAHTMNQCAVFFVIRGLGLATINLPTRLVG